MAAAGAKAGTQAAASGAKGLAAGFASWWSSLGAQAEPMKENVAKAAKTLTVKAQHMKLAMPVDVKASLPFGFDVMVYSTCTGRGGRGKVGFYALLGLLV